MSVFLIRHKDGERYVHRLAEGYALRRGVNNGAMVFEHRYQAKNFKRIFAQKDELEVIIDERYDITV